VENSNLPCRNRSDGALEKWRIKFFTTHNKPATKHLRFARISRVISHLAVTPKNFPTVALVAFGIPGPIF
jgi:hypothetical protein